LASTVNKKPKSYRDLLVWQEAMDLVAESYKLAKKLPQEELFGLRSQMQRAAVSVPANLAEGFGRWHRKEYLHHLRIAAGSVAELETHFIIAARLQYLQEPNLKSALQQTNEPGRMLTTRIQRIFASAS
jgi:four helix bundle protein